MADETQLTEEAIRSLPVESVIEVRDAAKREMDMRIVPWGVTIDTIDGPEEFARGAFDGADPTNVFLFGINHKAEMGLGQDGRPVLSRVPHGRGTTLDQRDDGAYLTVRVAKTAEGDDILALAREGIVNGVSIEFAEIPGGTIVERVNGRRKKVHHRVHLAGVSTTHRPAYGAGSTVVAVRSKGVPEVPENEAPEITEATTDKEPVVQPVVDLTPINARFDGLAESLQRMEERYRSTFVIPGEAPAKPQASLGDWMNIAIRMISGERVPDQQYRTVADVITTDNAGVVPDAYMGEVLGMTQARRPFIASVRRLNTPRSGMSLVAPVVSTHATTDVQSTEKTELDSTALKITTKSFDVETIGGVGDLSLQILKRSDPSFLELYLSDLAAAYAATCDLRATRILLDAVGGVGAGTALDPENLELGAAFAASMDATGFAPDTIWLSTDAVAAFIDAKNDGTNGPLYWNLASSITAAGGTAGTISGLNPIHVPALDAHGAFAIVGPSRGFAFAEDGTYTLQVDVPSKAGRDIALVGMVWNCPLYPDAFTVYNVAS